MWTTHAIPQVNLWTWPTYGEPQVLPSWGFRALLWPFYALGGVTGLFVWRWLTTLIAFALAWHTARRMGATGMTPLVVVMLCALVYRPRSQIRPETLATVLLALEIWILEARRHPRPAAEGAPAHGHDPTPWLIAIAWAWANVHISYYLGLVLIGIHWISDRLTRPPAGAGGRARPLGRVLILAVAVSFLNPFGWHALAQPFEYFFVWRHEPIYMTIAELEPMGRPVNLIDAIPWLLLAWPLLALERARRRRADPAEIATSLLFTGLALASQRFVGTLAIAAAPYLACHADAAVRARRWPAWSAPPWNRAALALAACAALTVLGWTYAELRPGIGFTTQFQPTAACDFIAAHGIRGRAFNQFELGGYLLWRFWPDRGRLPFMDIHQTGTREDRLAYVGAMTDAGEWQALDARHHFEWALLKRLHAPQDGTLDHVEADTTWALVFADDAAVLFVKRAGSLAAVADSFGYALAPAGDAKRVAVAAACFDDAALRARAEAELARMAAASAYGSQASSLLASLLMLDGRWDDARAALERARAVDPRLPLYRERLRTIAAAAGRLQQP